MKDKFLNLLYSIFLKHGIISKSINFKFLGKKTNFTKTMKIHDIMTIVNPDGTYPFKIMFIDYNEFMIIINPEEERIIE